MRGITINELLEETLELLRTGREHKQLMITEYLEDDLPVVEDFYCIKREDVEVAIQKILSVKELVKSNESNR